MNQIDPMRRMPSHIICPPVFRGQTLAAGSGSWKREDPVGCAVVRARDGRAEVVGYRLFVMDWRQDGAAAGRSMDIAPRPGEAILTSDNRCIRIFRIRNQGHGGTGS